MRKLLALLLLSSFACWASIASAQIYYSPVPIPPASTPLYVTAYGAKCDGTTDDSAAFSRTIAKSNTLWLAGTPNTIYIPAGRCYINAAITQFAQYVPGRVQGAGMYKSFVVVGSGLTGNVFSWDEVGMNGSSGTPSYDFSTIHNGGAIADLTMTANTGSGAQNAIVCLDRCDFFSIQNVAVWDFNGSAFSVGTANLTTVGFMRESNINNFKAWHDGSLTAPVLNLSCVTDAPTGNSDCTNEIQLSQIDIYDPRCVGVAINDQTTAVGTAHLFQFHTLRIEAGSRSTCDLLRIGDATANGAVHNVSIYGLEEIAVPTGAFGVHFAGTSNNIDSVNIEGGYIGSGPGGGVSVDVGKNIGLRDIYFGSSVSPAVTVAASTNLGCCIRVDGAIGYPTTSIDATSSTLVVFGAGQGSGTYPPWSFDVLGNETANSLTLNNVFTSSGIFGTTGIRTIIGGVVDQDTTSSGTITSTYINKMNGDTLRATSATTLTNAYTFDIEPPVASTNVTCTTCGSLRLAGQLQANGLINGIGGMNVVGTTTLSGGSVVINGNSDNAVNIGTGTNTQQLTFGGGSNTVAINASRFLIGANDAASVTNQTITTQGSRGGVDTNAVGANLTIQSGLGTGNATGSTITLQTPNVGSTGTTAETAVAGLLVGATAISIGNATSNPTFTFLGSGAISGTPVTNRFAAPGPIGNTTPSSGAFTTLTSSSGMPLSSLATQATNTVTGNATSGSAVPTALAVGTCSTAGSALNWTTNTGFGCNTAVDAATSTGVTNASVATAGKVGEVASINCIVGAAAASATTVSFTNASPTVVTWTSHTFVPSSGLANYTCPINFTGTVPTGVVVGTIYWIIGNTVSGDTFQIADTAAHALAGTNAINTSSTGTNPGAYIGALGANGTAFAGAALQLVAGDWQCSALGEFQELTSLTTSAFKSGISTSSTAFGSIGTFTQVATASGSIGANSYYQPSPVVHENISATTTVANIVASTFSGGTMNEGGFLQCWRIR